LRADAGVRGERVPARVLTLRCEACSRPTRNGPGLPRIDPDRCGIRAQMGPNYFPRVSRNFRAISFLWVVDWGLFGELPHVARRTLPGRHWAGHISRGDNRRGRVPGLKPPAQFPWEEGCEQMSDIAQRVKKIVVEHLGVDEATVSGIARPLEHDGPAGQNKGRVRRARGDAEPLHARSPRPCRGPSP
jgi:hypothetical protein